MSYVDTPNKKQKHPHYEHRTFKLDRKDNEFRSKEFQRIRKYSTHKKILKTIGRIGMCLNDKISTNIPIGDLDKVCFLLINDYDYKYYDYEHGKPIIYDENKKTEKKEEQLKKELGVGPLNDCYLIGLKHHRLGFKIFYLHNPRSEEFSSMLKIFLKYTTKALTIYYSGRGENGIEFNDGKMNKEYIHEIIKENYNPDSRIMFINDNVEGGSVFDINLNEYGKSNMISLSVEKNIQQNIERNKQIQEKNQEKEIKRTQGIFTYYFCKIITECPNITVNRLVERMIPSLKRFNVNLLFKYSNIDIAQTPIFSTK